MYKTRECTLGLLTKNAYLVSIGSWLKLENVHLDSWECTLGMLTKNVYLVSIGSWLHGDI